jgi:hypothetical protein
MDYTYFLEKIANNNISAIDLYDQSKPVNILYLLCYHVTNTCKYPFLQFMMEKIPYCNNIVKEQFVLPFIILNTNTVNMEEIVLNKIRYSLKNLNCDDTKVTNDMYKGIVSDNYSLQKTFAVVDISGIDISGLNLSRNSIIWFTLPSEIINTKSVCNIDIDDDVTDIFTNIPDFALLRNKETNNPYIIPDPVYTGGEYKDVEFNSVFGNRKSIAYESCGEYYYFYTSFGDAVKEGGWIKTNNSYLNDHCQKYNPAGRLIVDNEYGKYIQGGINRYALFVEGKNYIETENSTKNLKIFENEKNIIEFSVNTDEEIRSVFQISKEDKERLEKEEQYISMIDYNLIPATKYMLNNLL